MLGNAGYFRYQFPAVVSVGELRFNVIYKPPGVVRSDVLEDLVIDVCGGPLVPDALVFVSLFEDDYGSLPQVLRGPGGHAARTRLAHRIPLVCTTFSLITGAVVAEVINDGFAQQVRKNITDEVKRQFDAILKAGLPAAFPEEHVLLSAPPGYSYQKPSGARYDTFLKPEMGLTTSAAVGFVALHLFNEFFGGRLARLKQLRTIYVDTMAIAPLAYGIRELIVLSGHRVMASIESFHSYEGFDSVARPLRGTSICLISASSSMALHRRWVNEKLVDHSDVVTLLTFEAAPNQTPPGALLAIPRPGSRASEGPPQLVIRIKGETFQAIQEPDKKVLLREQIHGARKEVKLFRELAGKGIFDLWRRPGSANSKIRALYVDGTVLLQHKQFQDWLALHLPRRVRASTTQIIYQSDAASRTMAEYVAGYCANILHLKPTPATLDAAALNSIREITSDNLIICAAVVGKGSQLLDISRNLRDIHDGSRLYMIGFQVTETRSELVSLPANLRHDGVLPHEVSRFGEAAIGTQLAASYHLERKRLFPGDQDRRTMPDQLRERSERLGETLPIQSQALLPHGANVDQAMQIREGWAFWAGGKYQPGPYHAEVCATTAVLLQRAREDTKTVPEEHSLGSRTFRHVVLDPENFARFNDGILQAALLRCAFASELDFRADLAASDFMKSLIIRALQRSPTTDGEAVLEFIAALASQKLQLMPDHQAEVYAVAERETHAYPALHGVVLHLLHGPKNSSGSSPI
ncbi:MULTISPECIES: hypothetical protein [unclassified Duganella]|uniref:hypothetical protein n=1 Tax=unclassified Duganella TaxID=2636909 RepID=UPI00088B7FEF|nr:MULTISPECIES: hypothetical protein [unclassified Duganella]SDG77010.1 hypothetical protein SAMN05216320_1074 [Duganella sp. OV458]SDK03939.1 hypothetical protein SAMN05428973_1084 [Duganella sp. OV510]